MACYCFQIKWWEIQLYQVAYAHPALICTWPQVRPIWVDTLETNDFGDHTQCDTLGAGNAQTRAVHLYWRKWVFLESRNRKQRGASQDAQVLALPFSLGWGCSSWKQILAQGQHSMIGCKWKDCNYSLCKLFLNSDKTFNSKRALVQKKIKIEFGNILLYSVPSSTHLSLGILESSITQPHSDLSRVNIPILKAHHFQFCFYHLPGWWIGPNIRKTPCWAKTFKLHLAGC